MNPSTRPTNPAEHDLDTLLAGTRTRQWPGSARNTRVEEFLMMQSKKAQSSPVRRLSLWIGAGLLAATGVVYGAARIYERYTVRVEANGVASEHQVEAGPDGAATLVVPTNGGGQATIQVGRDDGQVHVNVEATGASGETTVQVSSDGTRTVKETKQAPAKK